MPKRLGNKWTLNFNWWWGKTQTNSAIKRHIRYISELNFWRTSLTLFQQPHITSLFSAHPSPMSSDIFLPFNLIFIWSVWVQRMGSDLTIEGSNMNFHSLTFARSLGDCWKPRAKPDFSTFPRDLANVNEWQNHVWSLLLHKFSKPLRKWRKHWRTIFYNLITFSYASMLLKTMHDSGPVQLLIISYVFCVAPGNKYN